MLLAATIVLKTSERNRTQTICAGLIASTIVSAGCADDCLCDTGIGAECPSSAPVKNASATMAAQLPLEGEVIFRLEPVVTALPLQSNVVMASLPVEPAASALTVDSISQADAHYSQSVMPPIRARRGQASNQNREQPMPASIPRSHGEILTSTRANEAEVQEPRLQSAKAPARESSNRPLLQDAYIAFGVNGR